MNKLSDILKTLLKHRKLTVSELSRHTGIVQPVIYRMTTGETDNPKLSSLLPIANYFNVSISQLIGEEPLDTTSQAAPQKITTLPLLPWVDAYDYKNATLKVQKNITASGLSNDAFALIMPDTSMEPMFQRGSLLIFDPVIEPQDRSFVLVQLKEAQAPVFRQLIIDVNQRYLKPLNPDLKLFKMRLLNEKDNIIAILIESRNYHSHPLPEEI